jgi:hypothetical protein
MFAVSFGFKITIPKRANGDDHSYAMSDGALDVE